MDKTILISNYDLQELLCYYRNFLVTNKISSLKSIDFIFGILDLYQIENDYLRKVTFDDNLKCKGVYIPEYQQIILNTSLIEAAYKLNFINFNQLIIDYFCLLLHEINHILQIRYRNSMNDAVTEILNISEYLKRISIRDKNKLHEFFPDEIDSNIRSSKIVYETFKDEESEKNLIYFLTSSLFYENTIVNSQINFLYQQLLNSTFDNNYSINSIYYGLNKSVEVIKAILDSYQTQKLCVDIEGERRLKNAIRIYHTK